MVHKLKYAKFQLFVIKTLNITDGDTNKPAL